MRAKLGISKDGIVGVFVGRVTLEKGLNYLLEALWQFNEWPDNLFILIVGAGEYLEAFENLAADISQNIICVGATKEVKDYLFASDFFIMPSLHENHSIALLEAIAANLPVVATNCGGNSEIVEDGKTGFLFDPKNSNAIHYAISLMLDETIRNSLKNAIRTGNYDMFSGPACDSALESVYNKLLNK